MSLIPLYKGRADITRGISHPKCKLDGNLGHLKQQHEQEMAVRHNTMVAGERHCEGRVGVCNVMHLTKILANLNYVVRILCV